MGPASCIVMAVASPLASQLTGVAPVTLTAEGPVMEKSLPFAAMVLHFTDSAKFIVSEVGRHAGGSTVPIANGLCAVMVNGTPLPAGIGVLQLSSTEFPSLPFAISIV